MHPSSVARESLQRSVWHGENGNVREAGRKVDEGRCEVSKSNGRLSEEHAREREGKWATVACCSARPGDGIYTVSSRQGQFVLLCARVSKQGKKRLKRVKFKLTRRQTARCRTIVSPVFKLRSTNVWVCYATVGATLKRQRCSSKSNEKNERKRAKRERKN